MPKVFVGDVGTHIEVLTGADLTDTTAVALKVRRSTALTTYVTWVAVVKDPPGSGIIEYVTKTGDLSEPGEYAVAAHVTFSDKTCYTGEVAILTVSPLFG